MVCTDLDALIEPIAAGEIVPDANARTHLASCAACARALELARQIDAVLAAQPVPDLPAAFTPALMGRLRRERWRSEQYLDIAFNIALGLAVVTAVGGLAMVLTASGLAAVSADLTRLFVSGAAEMLSAITPALPLYGVAAAVFVSGMAIWWWAEHGFEI
jgi:anti-sigma factor RsiW